MKFINNGNSFLLSAPASIFAAEIKNQLKRHTMFNGEKKQIIQSKRLADALFILWAGGAALLSYSLVYALRKPFTAAGFDGLDFFGMDYKTATSTVQISGYFISKLIGIKVISELKKENRLKFIILSVAVAELSLVLFGALPRPLNVFALFFNGLSLGCMWGVIFSFLEGRRVTDLLASLMGLSIAISSGTAKSVGLFVMEHLHISEFWMPAFIGAFAFPLLSLLGWLMTRMPQPTAADRALRSERVTLDGRARADLFKSFMPVLLMLFAANLFITVLQDIKEDFLVKILDVEAAELSSWAFAKVDAVVTLIILLLFGLMSAVRSNIKVLCLLLVLASRSVLPALTGTLLIPTAVFAVFLAGGLMGWLKEGIWLREGRFTLRRQKGVYLHCICVFHPDVCLRTFQSPWAARYQRMTLTLALPGQVRLKVRSIPVRDAAPCLNALEQKT